MEKKNVYLVEKKKSKEREKPNIEIVKGWRDSV